MKINRIRTESQKYNEGRSRSEELSQQLLQTLNKEGHGSLAECLDLKQPFSPEVEALVRQLIQAHKTEIRVLTLLQEESDGYKGEGYYLGRIK